MRGLRNDPDWTWAWPGLDAGVIRIGRLLNPDWTNVIENEFARRDGNDFERVSKFAMQVG